MSGSRDQARRSESRVPSSFAAAVTSLRAAADRFAGHRPDIEFQEIPAPRSLAPFAFAVSATVQREGEEVCTGRLMLLWNPAEPEPWYGPARLVASVQADLEPEVAADPLLGPVGWSWLTEALDSNAACYTAPSGTVTRTVTEGFGGKSDEPQASDLELRASWSPTGLDLAAHLAAWCDVMRQAAGLPPLPPEVAVLSTRHDDEAR